MIFLFLYHSIDFLYFLLKVLIFTTFSGVCYDWSWWLNKRSDWMMIAPIFVQCFVRCCAWTEIVMQRRSGESTEIIAISTSARKSLCHCTLQCRGSQRRSLLYQLQLKSHCVIVLYNVGGVNGDHCYINFSWKVIVSMYYTMSGESTEIIAISTSAKKSLCQCTIHTMSEESTEIIAISTSAYKSLCHCNLQCHCRGSRNFIC